MHKVGALVGHSVVKSARCNVIDNSNTALGCCSSTSEIVSIEGANKSGGRGAGGKVIVGTNAAHTDDECCREGGGGASDILASAVVGDGRVSITWAVVVGVQQQ